MRGEAEKKCFELVQKNLDYENFFAMSYKDRDLIKEIFEKAKPNANLSFFPDFIFDDGFIEHFQITSSIENRKGSLMEREKAEIRHDFDERTKEVSDNLYEDGITIQSVSTPQYWHQSHSYENFVQSFKSNLNHHIENMEKYLGNKNIKLFMVEYSDSALRMNKIYPKDLMHEVSYGDLIKREPPTYRISRDIELLKYLKLLQRRGTNAVPRLIMGRDPVELAKRAKYKPPAMRVRGVCYTKKSPFRYNEVVQAKQIAKGR